jgi:hypothetical protein
MNVKSSKMNKLHIWLLRKIFGAAFIQGPEHKKNLIRIYSLIREAMDSEFTEDGQMSLDSFCQEAFNESQKVKKPARYIGCKNSIKCEIDLQKCPLNNTCKDFSPKSM